MINIGHLPDLILSKQEVSRITGVHPETLRRWGHEGKFPRRIITNPNGRAGRRLRSEIEAWIAERLADRDRM